MSSAQPACRSCGETLEHTFVDLGMSPLCQTQIHPEQLVLGESFYPLHAFVCSACFLVQLPEHVAPRVIFGPDYPYFSSYTDSWVEHARRYVEHLRTDFGLGPHSFLVEIASNDGYLLQHAVAAGVPCLGVEPTAGTAAAARQRQVPTLEAFFGRETAREIRRTHRSADVITGNNVLAHVPDLNDFVGGIAELLDASGLATFEFPHLLQLMEQNQFDTIYHEHFCYFSLQAVRRVFQRHGLEVFAVRELPTHGGSLRIYVQRANGGPWAADGSADELLRREEAAGLLDLARYRRFQAQVHATKRALLRFLIEAREAGRRVAGYGAPGKGNTLLNYCGIGPDLLDFTVDRNPAKQGTYTPGTRIPILDPAEVFRRRPDFLLILPWNLREEIATKMAGIRDWGGRFVVPIPAVDVF